MNMKRITSGMLAFLMAVSVSVSPVHVYGEEAVETPVTPEIEQPVVPEEEQPEIPEPVVLAAPKIKSENVPETGKIKVSWEKIAGADNYHIYRSLTKAGPYKKKTSVTKCNYIDKNVKVGTRYYYKVRAVSKAEEIQDSSLSNVTYRYCDLACPVVKTSLRLEDAKPHLTWNAVDGAAKYKVYVSSSKNGTYKWIKTTVKTSCDYADAKAGCKYYFKVKAVSKKTSAANSAFSTAKARTCGAPYIVSITDEKYVYKDFKTDMDKLVKKYPHILKKTKLGKTADKRGLYALTFGNPKAKKQIFVTAGFHAREYINCQVTMRMIEHYCRSYETGKYEGISYEELFDEVSFCIIPMANPDGIAISAIGPSAIKNDKLRAKVKKMPKVNGYYFWKANARGVDLNNNYIIYKGTPDSDTYASEGYPGPKSFSEKETKAVLCALEDCSNVKAVINYHSMGNAIYWGYHSKKYKERCWAFAELFYEMTGYYMIDESYSDKARGDFEHYIMHEYRIPYVCIENGKTKVPVPNSEFKRIYYKNRLGFAKAAHHFYGVKK